MIRQFLWLLIVTLVFADQSPLCPPKWTFVEVYSACYYVSTERMTWQKASQFCQLFGGNLTSVDNVDEQTSLSDFIKTPLLTWTSLQRYKNSTVFYYADNAFQWGHWAPGEPSGVGDCGGLINSGTANNGAKVGICDFQQPFICQKFVDICPNKTVQTGVDGMITSMNYPNKYPNRMDCTYVVTGPPGTAITLWFDADFDVEPSSDLVYIYDGDSTDRNDLLYVIDTSYTFYLGYIGTKNSMTIRFKTTSGADRYGWKATWTAKVATHDIYATGASGTLSSDQYPDLYRPYLHQVYYIKVDEGKTITATFNHFDTEVTNDYLLIYDGPYLVPETTTKNISGSFAASHMPLVFQSHRKWMTLEFTTNGRIQKSGWNMTWVAN